MTETYSVSLPGRSATVKLFLDDTIDVIRTRIGIACGMHPDKLRLYVQAELPANYYSKDSRKWESLFLRMSPEGKPLGASSLKLFSEHTEPSWTLERTEYDKSDWMSIDASKDAFTELRILGASEERSWILPLDNTVEPPYSPPAAQVSIDLQSIFSSVHPYPIGGFRVIPYTPNVYESLYFPLLRPTSPAVVPDDMIRALRREDDLLVAILDRSPPKPERQTVLRARWKIPLVDTDLGLAIRNRMEQIFYGTTVDASTPVITFFGGRQEQSRHKFFVTNPKLKTPSLDLRMWQYWWTATKPSKNKPALLLFRGTGRFVYDRITINSTEITMSCHRDDTSTESLESLQTTLKEWFVSIDGLAAFVDERDLDTSRWVLQDTSASLTYPAKMKQADFRRFGCLRSIFEVVDHDKLVFKFLRSNQADLGLSPTELRVVQLLKDNEAVSPDDVSIELDITVGEATGLLASVKDKLIDNPDLLDRQYANLPTFRFAASTAVVTYAIDLPRITQYMNILRDILSNPDDTSLDAVCPSRMETVPASAAESVPVLAPTTDAAEGEFDLLDELLGEVAESNAIVAQQPAADTAAAAAPAKKTRKVSTKSAASLASYFVNQLREFDPDTYDPDDPQILRKCDKPRQPIILTPADLERMKDGEYDPQKGDSSKILDVKDPDGHVICPEFWCTFDRIPLSADQIGDDKQCPVCKGKVRSLDKAVEKTQDPIEFPVIQRDSTIVFPGFVKYKSKKNDRPIPCCFTTAQTTRVSAPRGESAAAAASEAYYILGESKTRLGPLRLGYIPRQVSKILDIPSNYVENIAAGNRLQAGQSGMYRVGIGRPSETLPQMLQFPVAIKPPIENVGVTMRCSFFRTWKSNDEVGNPAIIPTQYAHREQLAGRVASIDKAYKDKTLSVLEELEYAVLSLDCQLFVLYVSSDRVDMGCFMQIGAVRNTNRAIAVMIGEDEPEYIAHVARISTTPQFNGNLYRAQFFPPSTLKKLLFLRARACVSDIPTIDTAFAFINTIPALRTRFPEMQVIMDPYGRAQAVFLPETILLPFKPVSQIPTFIEGRISGYADIAPDQFPTHSDMIEYLKDASRLHAGYVYAHDAGNRAGVTNEIITASGLRIPVRSDSVSGNSDEVFDTVQTHGEDALVWGAPDVQLSTTSRSITYEAEVFDFLLYQLAHDIHRGEEYRPLRNALAKYTPSVAEVTPLLQRWMEDTLTFTEATNPPLFVKKMRSPCSSDNCEGNLCAWNGASCRVEIKTVRPTLNQDKLLQRLLKTLVANEKIRDIVSHNAMSPFFSSVLYLEAPHELIISDADVHRRISPK